MALKETAINSLSKIVRISSDYGLNFSMQTNSYNYLQGSCLLWFAALLNVLTYPLGAQSRGNCTLMARITRTGHQQETLLLSPISLGGKLSTQVFQNKCFQDYPAFPGVQIFRNNLTHKNYLAIYISNGWFSMSLFALPPTNISATVFCNDAAHNRAGDYVLQQAHTIHKGDLFHLSSWLLYI